MLTLDNLFMKNLLTEFKKYISYKRHERNLRGLFPDGIKRGTVIIEKGEDGHPYARFVRGREVEYTADNP